VEGIGCELGCLKVAVGCVDITEVYVVFAGLLVMK